MNNKNNYNHFTRFYPAIRNSLVGLKAAYNNEIAFRQYTWLTIVMLPLAWYLAASLVEFAVLTSTLILILISELLNSAVEAAIDRIGSENHQLSGLAKDLGSAAVFVAIVYFLLVWAFKLISYL
ncbi:MAG: diacylglycerol kinase [Cognaticolwellia aestuarii]